MNKLKDKIYRNLKIAALSAVGLFGSSHAEAQENFSESPKQNPTEVKADIFNDIIDFEVAEPRFTHQVDTVYDAEIGKQVDDGTYQGSKAYYAFNSNTVTKFYFANAENQPSDISSHAIDVHEEAHKHFANTYGLPIGILSPQQAYCFEFAKEFNGYIHETIYQMNESIKVDSVVGMNHYTNIEFGDLLAKDLGLKYKLGSQHELEEVLKEMTNSVFQNTYKMMISSPLYEEQLLSAARENSDVSGVPDDIRQENFEYAVNAAFTIHAVDIDGMPVAINLYDYLSEENRVLLNTIAPQHQEEIAKITAENDKLIAENTAKRVERWDKEATETSAAEGIEKTELLAQYQREFEAEAREFTFPKQPEYRKNDKDNHVSEAIIPLQYDDAFHLAPDYYEYLAAQKNTDNENDLALAQVRQKLQNLQERKEESTTLSTETTVQQVNSRVSSVNYSVADNIVER